MQPENDWTNLLGGVAQLSVVGNVADAIIKTRDAFINQILAQPIQHAVQFLIREVPRMEQETWQIFFQHFHQRAEQSDYAFKLLLFADNVHTISLTVQQLVLRPVPQAKAVLDSSVRAMDDASWNILKYILGQEARVNPVASDLLGYATTLRQRPNAEETFRASIKQALSDHIITPEEASKLERLRQDLQIPPEVARDILLQVRANPHSESDGQASINLIFPD